MQGKSNAITISTIHKAKGLQYKAVIVPYMSWRMEPDTRGRRLVVWAEAAGEGSANTADEAGEGSASMELARAGALPINYKSEMAGSYFSARYYREQVLAHIDAMNLFYVATTRAEQELHLMVSSNPYEGRNSVGNVLRAVLGVTEEFTAWGSPVYPAADNIEKAAATDAPERAATGAFTPPATGALHRYPTARSGAKMRMRLPSARYMEDGDAGQVGGISHGGDPAQSGEQARRRRSDPREEGVLMHRAFETATGAADVQRALDRMLASAQISPREHAHLQEVIAQAFDNPTVAEWFAEGWESVRNEGDILLPGEFGVRRPDRVMVRGTRAVVVDYKFGAGESGTAAKGSKSGTAAKGSESGTAAKQGTHAPHPAHEAQLRGYMSLLAAMGYTTVEGYLWYVSQGRIIKING
jgi:ATP-dependent exoDNAse (exonuclease V) beta subunit